jgi:malonyl-CoA O-methyltransferase
MKLNYARVKAHFDRAAATYDEAAVLQAEVARRLVERLCLFSVKPQRILDMGCGTGYLTQLIAKAFPQAEIVALDLSPAMLAMTQHRFKQLRPWYQCWRARPNIRLVEGDMRALPFEKGAFDLVISNMVIQWADDLDAVFQGVRHVLADEGLFLFTSFGPDTLKELRAAWRQVDPQHDYVSDFIDMHDAGDGLVRARFGFPVMDVETFTLTYENAQDLLRDLKSIGATNALEQSSKGLMTPSKLKAMVQAYEAFRRPEDQRLPASYEVVYGHAFAATMKPKHPEVSGVQVHEVAVEQIGRR